MSIVNHKFAISILTVLFVLKVILLSTRPQYDDNNDDDDYYHVSSSSPYFASPLKKEQRQRVWREDIDQWHADDDDGISTTRTVVEQQQQQPIQHQAQQPKHPINIYDRNNGDNDNSTSRTSTSSSDAPLFYHLSPGSSGSRTLYHASCTAGFPSVHHKSFCISQQRGIKNVSDSVVMGVRSHFELLRLYTLAYECCKLHHAKGEKVPKQKQLCNMPLHTWVSQIQTHLISILQSGLVGLFDTPYPYLAPQVLELAKLWRSAPPIIAMTERNAREWAMSRSKHHALLVCKMEYSYDRLGASEFDVLGCYERAVVARRRDNNNATDDDSTNNTAPPPVLHLHFWDIFQYRARVNVASEKNVDLSFQLGMERQMNRHQLVYLPMADYAPDMFGVHSSSSSSTSSTRIEEEDVVVDIRRLILGDGKSDVNINDDDSTTERIRSQWREEYTKPLTCRGRVHWNMDNDSLVEVYHLPKTCADDDDGEEGLSSRKDMLSLIHNTHDNHAR